MKTKNFKLNLIAYLLLPVLMFVTVFNFVVFNNVSASSDLLTDYTDKDYLFDSSFPVAHYDGGELPEGTVYSNEALYSGNSGLLKYLEEWDVAHYESLTSTTNIFQTGYNYNLGGYHDYIFMNADGTQNRDLTFTWLDDCTFAINGTAPETCTTSFELYFPAGVCHNVDDEYNLQLSILNGDIGDTNYALMYVSVLNDHVGGVERRVLLDGGLSSRDDNMYQFSHISEGTNSSGQPIYSYSHKTKPNVVDVSAFNRLKINVRAGSSFKNLRIRVGLYVNGCPSWNGVYPTDFWTNYANYRSYIAPMYNEAGDIGFNEAIDTRNTLLSFLGSVLSAPVNFFRDVLNFSIFGFNIFNFICGVVTLFLLGFVLKKVL